MRHIFFLFLLLYSFSAHATEPLIIGVGQYPPFYYTDSAGNWRGIEVDIARAVLEKAQLPYAFKDVPWVRSLRSMQTGSVNIMLALSKTPEREEYIDYIGASRFEQLALIVHEDYAMASIETIDDICNHPHKLGVERDMHYPVLEERLKDSPALRSCIEYVHSAQQNLEKARMGRIIGFFEDKNYAKYMLKSDQANGMLRIHPFRLGHKEPVFLGVSKSTPDTIRDVIRSAYQELEKEGKLLQIWKQWSLLSIPSVMRQFYAYAAD